MKIDICKSIPKDTRKVIRAAIEASHAHAPMRAKKLKVEKVKKKKNYSGESTVTGNTATIRVKLDHDYIDTVFHECYHIHQIGTGELLQVIGGFKWYGVFIPTAFYRVFYNLVPFEISAVRFAKKMCKKWEQLQ